jgi:hypothetical protein
MKALLLLWLLAVPAIARVNETLEQCANRYGAPFKVLKPDVEVIYQKAGLNIFITFWNGKASMIFFSKMERGALDNPDDLSDAEIQTLLDANSGGSTWKKSEALLFMKSQWTTADGKLNAQYESPQNYLFVVTAAYNAHREKERAKEEKKALEGF